MALKHSNMILYSDYFGISSHRARMVLAEKGISVNIIYVDYNRNILEKNLIIKNFNSFPVLIDRDLIIEEIDIITEYLDERFPYPPLLPVYPVSRAKCRLMISKIEREWFPIVNDISSKDKQISENARNELKNQIVIISQLFSENLFFLNDDLSLVDCCIAPIFWRLKYFGITLPKQTQTQYIFDYIKRIFSRESFKLSLSDFEREMDNNII